MSHVMHKMIFNPLCYVSCSLSQHPQTGHVWTWRATGWPRVRWSRLWTPATSSPPQSNSTSATLVEWYLQGRKTVAQPDLLSMNSPQINGSSINVHFVGVNSGPFRRHGSKCIRTKMWLDWISQSRWPAKQKSISFYVCVWLLSGTVWTPK